MKSLSLVVEQKSDATLMRKYLPPLPNTRLRFFAGEGRLAFASLARNLLVHEPGNVLVVMDADTLNPGRAEEDRLMAMAAMRSISQAQRSSAFAFVPGHEVVFFEAPQVLHRYWDSSVLTETVLERGLYDSRRALDSLLQQIGQTRSSWFSTLTPADGDDLRNGKQASALITMVQTMAQHHSLKRVA